jgi:SNF2 family DNA or RNA helicase
MICTDAGRFGLNITGADTVVHFGSVYNPATMTQREDRLHRIGQKSSVTVYSPYFEETIDEGIRKVFHDRGEVAQAFMEGSEKMSISRLSKRDFRRMVMGK